MDLAGVSSAQPDLAVASTSTKTRASGFGLFRSIYERLFEPNNGPEYGVFSCFHFLRSNNYTDQFESKVTIPANDSNESQDPGTSQKEKGDVQICEKCKKIFLLDDVAGEFNGICPTCHKAEEEEKLHCKNVTSDVGASGEDTEIETSTDDSIFHQPIQCISCKKIYRTKLLEYMTDTEIFTYECLACNIRQILISKQPASAFYLASSIVENEIAEIKKRMWDSMCEMHSSSPIYNERCDRKCAASICIGNSRNSVQCNLCRKCFHTRCASLPDYHFQFFRCNECRNANSKEKNWSSVSGSLEQRALLRKPQIIHKAPEPMVCHICKSRILYKFDHLSRKPEPHQLLCLNCMRDTELMV